MYNHRSFIAFICKVSSVDFILDLVYRQRGEGFINLTELRDATSPTLTAAAVHL